MKVEGKVDVFLVGAPKTSTSTIFRYLTNREEFFESLDKEPHFFSCSRPKQKSRSYKTIDEYMNLFEDAEDHQLLIDASTSYFSDRTSPARIAAHNHAAKIIIPLRHPVDRAYSQYCHNFRDCLVEKDFEYYFRDFMNDEYGFSSFDLDFFGQSFYAASVERFLDMFPRDQILFVFQEVLRDDPETFYRHLCSFLEIEYQQNKDQRHYNKTGIHSNNLIRIVFAEDHFVRRLLRSLALRHLPFKHFSAIARWRRSIVEDHLKPGSGVGDQIRGDLLHIYKKDIELLEDLVGCELNGYRH